MAPYCYRCRYNRAKPERRDARDYRVCRWECVGEVHRRLEQAKRRRRPYTGFVVEPVMQGAAGMIPQPGGWLGKVAGLLREYEVLLIADEVMTGFGRTGNGASTPGTANGRRRDSRRAATGLSASGLEGMLFAHQAEEHVRPDFLCVAKGLTGGYLPMAATLTTERIFEVFLGRYDEFKTFFHGHSYTGNALGSAAALASLDLLQDRHSIADRARLAREMGELLVGLWTLPQVGDIRQAGLVAGIELVRDWRTREPFDLRERVGIRVCEAMARRGVLTRPIGNVVVLMPPFCTTSAQLDRMVAELGRAVREVLGSAG